MCDRDQEIFNHAEDISLHLSHLQGSAAALYTLLEADLAARPDKGLQVYAVLAAVEHFGAAAAAEATRVARLVSGVIT